MFDAGMSADTLRKYAKEYAVDISDINFRMKSHKMLLASRLRQAFLEQQEVQANSLTVEQSTEEYKEDVIADESSEVEPKEEKKSDNFQANLLQAYKYNHTDKLIDLLNKPSIGASVVALSPSQAKAIASDKLLALGCDDDAITKPYFDYGYWIRKIQDWIPRIIYGMDDLWQTEVNRYIEHGGISNKVFNTTSTTGIVANLIYEIRFICNRLNLASTDNCIQHPSYYSSKPFYSHCHASVNNKTWNIIAPVNEYASNDKLLVSDSEYQLLVSLKGEYTRLTDWRIDSAFISPIITTWSPHDIKKQYCIFSEKLWNVDIIGGHFRTVELLRKSASAKDGRYSKQQWDLIKQLHKRSNTTVSNKYHQALPDWADELTSIPNHVHIGLKNEIIVRDPVNRAYFNSKRIEMLGRDGSFQNIYKIIGWDYTVHSEVAGLSSIA